MTIFTLRPATLKDADAALKLYRDCAAQQNSAWDEDYPNMEILQSDIAQKALFLAERDGELAGAVTLIQPEAMEEKCMAFSETEKPCTLTRLCIAPKWQGKGLGKVLLKMSEKQAARMGYTAVHLLCDVRNETAYGLYRKNGYAKVGETALYDTRFYAIEKTEL